MPRTVAAALLATACLLAAPGAHAIELASFLQPGDVFCTSQADYDDFVTKGHVRPNSALETCQNISLPTRVAVLGGAGKVKSMVRVMNGQLAYTIGWTNASLPLAK